MSLSGGRESLLIREIEGYKRELMTKTDKLNVAIKSNSEVCTLIPSYIPLKPYFKGLGVHVYVIHCTLCMYYPLMFHTCTAQ